jgi:hypothetical protein
MVSQLVFWFLPLEQTANFAPNFKKARVLMRLSSNLHFPNREMRRPNYVPPGTKLCCFQAKSSLAHGLHPLKQP